MPASGEPQKVRTALDEALRTLGESVRFATWRHLEQEFDISLTGTRELTRQEIQHAIEHLFGDGAEAIMSSFELKLRNGTS
jgi:hypothetical protein